MNQVLSTEEILAIEHRGTKDEGLRFARAIEAAILAKLNSAEPVGEIRHHPGGCYEGSHIPAAPYDFPEFYGPLPPVGTKLYTTPQPDRTAGLEAALREARDTLQHYLPGGSSYRKPADATIATINQLLKGLRCWTKITR